MSNIDYYKVLSTAFDTKTYPERAIGCCRVYVVLMDKEHAKGMAAAAKRLGRIFQTKAHYNLTNALYIGYDNCSGHELAKATEVVRALKAAGIKCYREEMGD